MDNGVRTKRVETTSEARGEISNSPDYFGGH